MTAQAVDENGCSGEPSALQVLVATAPSFNTQVTSPLCEDAQGSWMEGTCKEPHGRTSLPR